MVTDMDEKEEIKKWIMKEGKADKFSNRCDLMEKEELGWFQGFWLRVIDAFSCLSEEK